MGRKKILIKPIEEERQRQVTLTKRKAGLFKKAYELSVLTKSEVALMVFDSSGRLYQYSSLPMGEMLSRVVDHQHDVSECHSTVSLADVIRKKKKKGKTASDDGDSDDDDGESEAAAAQPMQPPSIMPAPAGLPTAAPNVRRKGPPLSNITIPPTNAGISRLPSFSGPSYPDFLPNMPSPMPSMLPFPFPPASPGFFSNPVLHSDKSGDLIVSNSVQQNSHKVAQQLHRQNSAGMAPATGAPAVLIRTFSQEYSNSFGLSRMNSISNDPGSAALPSFLTSGGLASPLPFMRDHPGLQFLFSQGFASLPTPGAPLPTPGPAAAAAAGPYPAAAAAAGPSPAPAPVPVATAAAAPPSLLGSFTTAAAGKGLRSAKRPAPLAIQPAADDTGEDDGESGDQPPESTAKAKRGR